MRFNREVFFWLVLYVLTIIFFILLKFEAEWMIFWTIGFCWQALFKFPKFIWKIIKRKKKFSLLSILIHLTFKIKTPVMPFFVSISLLPLVILLILSMIFQSNISYWSTILGSLFVEAVSREIKFINKLFRSRPN